MRSSRVASILLTVAILMSVRVEAAAQAEVGYFGPKQLVRGQISLHTVRAKGLKLSAVQFSPADGIAISEITEVKPGEWSFKATVGKAAATGERTVAFVAESGQFKPVTVKLVDHAPAISDVKILATSPSWEVATQFTVVDEMNDVDQEVFGSLVVICSNAITSAATKLGSVAPGPRPNTKVATVKWFGGGQRFSGTCEGVISIEDKAGNKSNDVRVPLTFQ